MLSGKINLFILENTNRRSRKSISRITRTKGRTSNQLLPLCQISPLHLECNKDMRYTNKKWIVVKCSWLAKQFTINTPCDYSAVDIKIAPDIGRGQPNVFTTELNPY